jgi:diguanylate cyclase (GGDEF)-like protein
MNIIMFQRLPLKMHSLLFVYHYLNRYILVLFSVTLLGVITPAYAHENISDYFIENWSSRDGLPHNSVNAIAQTDDGYLWFATWEGVARYNGLEFKVYQRGHLTGMQDSGTRALTAGVDNQLWVGGVRGSLTRRLGFSWQALDTASSLVNGILVDRDDNLWTAIEGKGVYFQTKNGVNYGLPVERLGGVSAYRLVEGHDGVIYAATDNGLYAISSHDVVNLFAGTELNGIIARYVSLRSDGAVLVATDRGAWQYKNQQFIAVTPEFQSQPTTLIEQDSSGALWIGTSNHGIARYDGDHIEILDSKSGLSDNRILAWFQDKQNNIWIGTNGGITRLRDASISSMTESDGLKGDYTRTVLALDDHRFWVGSSNGLSLIAKNGATFDVIDNYPTIALSILSLAQSHDGDLFIGTYSNGLWRLHDGILQPELNEENGLPSNEVRAILPDDKGNLWLATTKGIVKRGADGHIQLFNKANSALHGDYILALAEDEKGRIWFGSGVGAGYIEADQVHVINIEALEQAQYAFGFHVEKGFVWIATDRGIICYQQSNGKVSLIGRPAGLPIDKFFQILADNKGSFWLTSNQGLWRINYKDAHDVATGKLGTIPFEHFDEDDGMASSQINGGSNPASGLLSSGELFFPTAKGVAIVDPKKLASSKMTRLPVVLESVSFDHDTVDPDIRRLVPAKTGAVRFSYVGLGFVIAERLQYRTKLVGFETSWSYRGNQTVAEYTNLSPGHYRFLVSARYPYGQWFDSEYVYEFEVEPKFWQRKDSIIFAVLGVVVAIWLSVQFRLAALRKSEHHLKEQVELQTEELRRQAQRFKRLSHEDALTGLANRRAFDRDLQAAFMRSQASNQPLSLALIDIDHFKWINDKHSHLIGDQALVAVGALIAEYVGDPCCVARWGGEEFTVLFNGSENDAVKYFETLRHAIDAMDCSLIANDLHITVSIGVVHSVGVDNYDGLLTRADHALFEAKQAGRNQVKVYSYNDESMNS